ncbi:MAG: TonB-dependent receptor plug domain-containing protein [Muribaculaceae bacterium]
MVAAMPLSAYGSDIGHTDDAADSIALREVEVTARPTAPQVRSAAPLQIVDSKNIEALGLQSLTDAVKLFSGVTVQDYGGIGGLKTVSVRSLGAKHTGVIYDGVAISDAQNGQIDLSRFSLDNVETIALSMGQTDDILRPARAYASAGVLSITSAKPSFDYRPVRITAKVRAGSWGFVNPYLSYDQRLSDHWAASARLDYTRADSRYHYKVPNVTTFQEGERRNSDIEAWRAEVNAYGHYSHATDITLKAYFYDSERGLPGAIILYNDYSSQRLYDRNAFVQAHLQRKLSERLDLQAAAKYNYLLTHYLDYNDKYAGGVLEDRHIQHEGYASAAARYRFPCNISAALTSDITYNTLRSNLPSCPFPKRITSQTVLAAAYYGTHISAVASLLASVISEHVAQGHERPDTHRRLSPALSIAWRLPATCDLRLRTSVKDAMRVPTFNDMYYLRIGNVNLRPERALQYNVGATFATPAKGYGPLKALSLTADAYYNRVHDKIVAIPTLYIWKMMNMGTVGIAGLDIALSADIALPLPSTALHLQGAYTFQHAIDITDPAAKTYHHQLPYTPRHSGNIAAALDLPWLTLSYIATFAGERYALAQNIPDNRIPPYAQHDISAARSFSLPHHTAITIRAEMLNVGDANYDVIKYYPMPGRSWRASVAFSF